MLFLGPVSQRIEVIALLISENAYLKKYDPIKSQFCTCPDSGAVVTCAELWPGYIIANWIQITLFSKRLGLWVHRPFVKWVHGPEYLSILMVCVVCPSPGRHVFSGLRIPGLWHICVNPRCKSRDITRDLVEISRDVVDYCKEWLLIRGIVIEITNGRRNLWWKHVFM